MDEDLARLAPAPSASVAVVETDDLDEFGPQYSLKDVRQLRALRAFVASGRINAACKVAGVKSSTWYRWRDEDRDFANAFEKAKEMLADDLEGVAFERARQGSDTLLAILLKALKPEKYREKQTITIVSPEVHSRLGRQADAIATACRASIEDPVLRARVITAIANELRQVWA